MKVPWKSSLFVRFFLLYLLGAFFIAILFHIYSEATIKDFYISSLAEEMQEKAKLLGRLLPTGPEGEALDKICRDFGQDSKSRITVIALDGRVLCDSDQPSQTMENHGTRSEVVEALTKGAGRSVRHSATVGYDMLYQAVLQRGRNWGRIVRVSIPLDAVNKAVSSIRGVIFLGLLLVSGLGLLLAFFFSRQLRLRVKRMAEFSQEVSGGSFPKGPLQVRGEDELSVLEKNLIQMSESIQENMKRIVEGKEKVESILRCMTEGVLVVDTQGRVILLNQNARKMFNLPSEPDLFGSLMEISRHPEMKRLMDEVQVRDSARQNFAKEISLEDGRYFRVSAGSLKDGEEHPLGHILVFHDVTELRRLETVRADFVANVSHELRTPLTAIRGYSETLLRAPPSDPRDAEQFLGIIHRHSERLGRLIDDLLALSDLESGKIQLAKENLQPGRLVEHVLEIFQDQAKKEGVTLSQTIGLDLLPIFGDPDRLQQLLINLVDNAIKYTPSGGRVTVTASLVPRAEKSGSRMVELAVGDSGCGIPEKELPRLTERFYRVDKARSRELGGTGLGLAIVKHIVQAHGGFMKIESQLQKGTTVRVCLPVEDE